MPESPHALNPELLQQFAAAQSSLYAFILTLMTGQQDAAADVLQETNVKLCREMHRYDASRPFLPWAMTLAKYEVMAWRTRQQRSRLVLDNDVAELMADEAAEMDAKTDAELRALESCLEAMPERQRALLRDRYEMRETVRSIAKRTSQPENALAALLYRMRKALHECITTKLTQEGFA